VLAQLQEKYPEDVRLAYRHFPLNIHQYSRLTAQAAEAAGKQGKFFEMKSKLFKEQDTWAVMEEDAFKAWLQAAAGTLGLDVDQFTADMLSKELVDKVEKAYQSATNAGIPGTPFMFINGQVYQAQGSLEMLESYVRLMKDQYKECPPFTVDPTGEYVATLDTTNGKLELQLYPGKAPVAVNNFIFLAKDGWYKDNHFTVQEGTAVFTGDPTGTGLGNPGFFYEMEINDLKFDKAGVVAMYNQGPNSSGSMFFITLKEVPDIDGHYTIIGQLISGMDVLTSLTSEDTLKDVIIEEK
jgi:cyclophilin family peptidyl-prolyl cis-trans isomerase